MFRAESMGGGKQRWDRFIRESLGSEGESGFEKRGTGSKDYAIRVGEFRWDGFIVECQRVWTLESPNGIRPDPGGGHAAPPARCPACPLLVASHQLPSTSPCTKTALATVVPVLLREMPFGLTVTDAPSLQGRLCQSFHCTRALSSILRSSTILNQIRSWILRPAPGPVPATHHDSGNVQCVG